MNRNRIDQGIRTSREVVLVVVGRDREEGGGRWLLLQRGGVLEKFRKPWGV